jgi:hypothetical protein
MYSGLEGWSSNTDINFENYPLNVVHPAHIRRIQLLRT